MLTKEFFNQDALQLAKKLLGKILRVKYKNVWLAARIIETECYYKKEKGSHASLGFTEKRKALFMSPGTIYMYYARGGDSLNFSARGAGNAVLIKSGMPFEDEKTPSNMIQIMQQLNPVKNSNNIREPNKLCSGQTLLCRSLQLKVPCWDQQQFDPRKFYVEDIGYKPQHIIQTTRLGIPSGRDEHLPYRFVDAAFVPFCTRKPKLNKPERSIFV